MIFKNPVTSFRRWIARRKETGGRVESREVASIGPLTAEVALPDAGRQMEGVRKRQLEELKDSVESHLPILPVVDAQLREANQHIEDAIAKIGAKFESMVNSANAGANEASRLLGAVGGVGEGGIDALLSNSRATLEHLMERIVLDGEVCRSLLETTDSLRQDLSGILRALQQVDDISSGNIILALNAKLEAVHIGERGTAFGVVAQELRAQARNSQAITENIRATALRLAGVAQLTDSAIRKLACANSEKIVELQRQVEKALNHLERAHGDMRQSVVRAAERSSALTVDVESAVETLQFQDRISQQIGHILDAMASMRAELQSRLDPLGRTSPSARTQSAAVQLLAHSYTMHGERSVHAAALGGEVTAHQALDDVEIF